MNLIKVKIIVALSLISLVASCAGRENVSSIQSSNISSKEDTSSSSVNKEIKLNVSSLSLKVGETKRVNITSLPETNEVPVWEIDESLADVSLSFNNYVGEIRAKKKGETNLTVSLRSIDASVSIPVTIEENDFPSTWPVISPEAKDYYSSIDFTKNPSDLLISLGSYNRSKKKNSSYSAANAILAYAQEDPNKKGNVILFYTGESRAYDSSNPNASSVNKEHVWPRSRGIKNGDSQADGDPHNLHLTDSKENSSRGNNVYGDTKTSNTFYVSNPIYQGEASRSSMYMQLTYYKSGLILNDDPSYKSGTSKNMGMISTLLKWDVSNPVTSFEERRNNRVQEKVNNRNPFVDIPGLSLYLYGGTNDKTKEIYHQYASQFGLNPDLY